ncbi:MAG TPA: class F sortase [Actinophytocola sp.]|nr:class F sortase [Actinophytocola sp.]
MKLVLGLVGAAAFAFAATFLIATELKPLLATHMSTSDTAAPPPPDPGMPVRVTIPAIGVDAPLVPVGLKQDGSMQTPKFGHAAWYKPGPRPGEPGPAVLVAHVDSKVDGPDVFQRLRDLAPGDKVTVYYPATTKTFAVTGAEQAPKNALPVDRIWGSTTDPVLRLITCGGEFDHDAGSYLDNVIVYADRLV